MRGRRGRRERGGGAHLAAAGVLAGLVLGAATAGAAERWALGLRGGVNVSAFDGALSDRVDLAKWGYCAGGFATVPVWGPFQAQPELLFTEKGGRYEESLAAPYRAAPGTIRNAVIVTYLEAPLLLRAVALRRGQLTLSTLAGPAFAFKLDSDLARGAYTGSEPVDPRAARDRDLGVVIGFEAALAQPRGRALLDVRLTQGSTNVLDPRRGPSGGQHAWSLSVGYTL